MKKAYSYYFELFYTYLDGTGYNKNTLRFIRPVLNRFSHFLREKNILDIRDIHENTILDFLEYVKSLKRNGKNHYTINSVVRIVSILRNFFRFLYRNDILLFNHMEILDIPIKKIKKRKSIFTVEEIDIYLDSISLNTPIEQCFRSIFELMYSSGLRISEIEKLDLNDIDLKNRVLLIRNGKGSKDRYIPFSETACKFLKKYIADARKYYLEKIEKSHRKALFLNENGRIKSKYIRDQFRKKVKLVKFDKKNLTPHSIRHSTATHLLENGANIRYVQELLGHENIETTVKYTQLQIDSIKRIYKSYHPRENQYYIDLENEYLTNLEALEEEIVKRREINKRFPPSKYNKKRK